MRSLKEIIDLPDRFHADKVSPKAPSTKQYPLEFDEERLEMTYKHMLKTKRFDMARVLEGSCFQRNMGGFCPSLIFSLVCVFVCFCCPFFVRSDFACPIVRKGVATQPIMTWSTETKDDGTKVVSVLYDGKHGIKSLNLVFPTAEEATFYYDAFSLIQKRLQGRMGEILTLSKFFRRHADSDGAVPASKVELILEDLDVSFSRKAAQAALRSVDQNKDGKLQFPELLTLYRRLQHVPALSEVFQRYGGSGEGPLSREGFVSFAEKEQRMTREEALKLLGDAPSLTLDEFQLLVTDPSKNGALGIVPAPQMDMKQPLQRYFVNSSHNTYLVGDQLKSPSSIENFAVALKIGIRCVEIDAWNGDATNGPIVHHGFTLTGRLLLRDVLRTVARHAFETSPYPVILSVENHCSPEQQDIMAALFLQILGDENIYRSSGAASPLPSPEELRGKFLVKAQIFERRRHDHSHDEGGPVKEAPKAIVSQAFRSLIFLEIGDFDDNALTSGAPNVMANFSEPRTLALAARIPDKLQSFCNGTLVRVYPKGLRVDSSNPDPLPFWKHGCQIVALNMQHYSIENFVNFAKFSENNQAGYVLRPNGGGGGGGRFRVRVLGARGIPRMGGRDVFDPYVVVRCMEYGKTHESLRTPTVQDNGLAPDFNGTNEIVFEVADKHESFLVLELWDENTGRDILAGFFSAPFTMICHGFRMCPLLARPHYYPMNRGLSFIVCQFDLLQ